MNRSLLLIVCDFLLLSLLALADFEKSGEPIAAERTAPAAEYDPTAEDDEESAIAGLLAAALSAEQSAQEQLERELREARERISTADATLADLETNLAERERDLSRTRTEAEKAAEEARRLAAEKSEIEQAARETAREKERLAGEKEALESKTAELTDRVERLSGRAEADRQELDRKARELARAEAELEKRARALEAEEARRREAEAARLRLAGEVETVRREKELLSSNLESAEKTIEVERREKAELRQQTESLSENVTRLADASSEITEEVRNLRPLTGNEIFRKADANRVTFVFEGTRTGLFSDAPFTEEIPAVVTVIGDQSFLWLHVEQTPFADPDRRRFLKSLDLFIEANGVRFRVPRMGALEADPSLLFLPLTDSIVERLGVETFPASKDPFRFEDLVVVDLPESRFGESGFRVQPDDTGFLEIDNRAFSALFGEFSPSRGDVAFTRAGAFLGIVVRPGEAWQAAPVQTGLRLSFGEEFTRNQLDGLP